MWQSPVIVQPPAGEPVTLAEAKQFLRLNEDDDGFDSELAIHIAGARGQIEAITSTRMISQTLDLETDMFGDFGRLPIGPVTEIVSVRYRENDGEEQLIPADALELLGAGLQQGFRFVDGGALPALASVRGPITVRLVAGYGEDGDTLPASIRIALLKQIRALFEDTTADLEPWLANDRIWL